MIWDAIGQCLPIAVGVMVSPLPIVAVVLMLMSGRARANAITFVSVWYVTVGAIVAVVALLAGSTQSDDGPPNAWTGWFKVGLGLALLFLALRQWQGRARNGAEPETPHWMAAIDAFTPVKSAGLAALLGGANPKNLLLSVSAGFAIATVASGDIGVTVGATVIVAVIASVGVAAPVVVYLTAGDGAAKVLGDIKTWMVAHNAVIMTVLLLVIGAKLIGDGITII